MLRSERTVGFLLIALSAACFGAMPIFGRAAYAAGADPTWRRQCGGDKRSLVDAAQAMAKSSIEARLASVSDPKPSLPHRAVAARSFWGTADAASKSNLAALFAAFRSLGVPEDLIVATEIAAIRTREPITIMVPLIRLETGTFETCRRTLRMSADRGRPEVIGARSE